MSKTTQEILEEIRKSKPCSRTTLYFYFNKLGIAPIGAHQKPQRWPGDAASRILGYLGLLHENAITTQKAKPEASGIVSMKQLRAERAKARRVA